MTEADNLFVSSRGILKSCDYYSSTPYSSIKQLVGYPDEKNLKNINIPSIYICGNAIPRFIKQCLKNFNFKFILVSGDCDETIPNDILSPDDFDKFINDWRIVHWFCQNCVRKHKKITIIPIGLDYHTMTTKNNWGPITACLDQERILNSVRKRAKICWEREVKCYANFHFSMKTKFGTDRINAQRFIDKELVFYEPKQISRMETWNNQKNYAFVISPHGGGLDCHRTWEALIIGCIPIIKSSPIDHLFQYLPVLVVSNWDQINMNLLERTIKEFRMKYDVHGFSYNQLMLGYWKDKINSYK